MIDLGAPQDADKSLVAAVHPPDWQSPQPQTKYNLVVIGGGSAGLVAAFGAAGLGAKVALVEKHLLGGDCLNYGCVPSKALLHAGKLAAHIEHAPRFGIHAKDGVKVDFAAVMARLRSARAQIAPNDSAARLKEAGVDVFLGEAQFSGRQRIRVGETELRFAKAVIATGGRARVPPIDGLSEAGYLTNESVFSLQSLPPRLGVIGAGAIGCELAQAFARLGSQVTLFCNGPQILAKEDPSAAKVVAHALEQDGVTILYRTQVTGAARSGESKHIEYRLNPGNSDVTDHADNLAEKHCDFASG